MNKVLEGCTRCKRPLPRTDEFFYRYKRGKYFFSQCKECVSSSKKKQWQSMSESDPDGTKALSRSRVLKKYGLTPQQYEEMFSAQIGRCAICKLPSAKTLAVDHCHETGKVRALLCSGCNTGIGSFKDSIVLLQAATEYVDQHRVRAENDDDFAI